MKMVLAGVCASLLLSALMLVGPNQSASAQQAVNEVCVSGTYVNGSCEVRTAQAPDCEPVDCVVEVDRLSGPAVVPARYVPVSCPDGSFGTPANTCAIFLAKGTDGCSSSGTVSFEGSTGDCIAPVANKREAWFCNQGGTLSTAGPPFTCTYPDQIVYGFCPSGTEAFNGTCASFSVDGLSANCGLLNEDLESLQCLEPAELLPSGAGVCQTGTQFIEGACVAQIPGIGLRYCVYPDVPNAANVLSDALEGDCVSREPALIVDCPTGFSRDSYYADGCYRFEPNAADPCELTVKLPEGFRCFVYPHLTDQAAATYCAEGSVLAEHDPFRAPRCNLIALVDNTTCPPGASGSAGDCYLRVPFGLRCGEAPLVGGGCLVRGLDPVVISGVCERSDTRFLDGNFCYDVVDGSSCDRVVAGECQRAAPIRPQYECPDADFKVIWPECVSLIRPDPLVVGCPAGATQVPGALECRVAVTAYTCGAFRPRPIGDTCTSFDSPAFFPQADDYVCDAGTRRVETTSTSTGVACVIDSADPSPDPVANCTQGTPDPRLEWCLISTPFSSVTCPFRHDPVPEREYCELVLPERSELFCDIDRPADEVRLTFNPDGTGQCWERTGPQPERCPGVVTNEQCFAFVSHRLACAPSGCLTSTAPLSAAPAAERGDVDCNGQLDIRDALAIVQALDDPELDRQETCGAVNATGGMRITAADLLGDGTVNGLDAKQLLQCLADDRLSNCAN